MNHQNNQVWNRFSKLSSAYGVITGFLMAAILLIFQITHHDYSPGLKLISYFFLGGFIVASLVQYKSRAKDRKIFFKGMFLGNKLSFFAGVTLVLLNFVLFIVSKDYAFSKYTIEPTTITQLLMVSFALLFETIVFGMIVTFVTLQYLKEPVRF